MLVGIKLTPEQIAQICELYRQGMPRKDIAVVVGCCRNTVSVHANNAGLRRQKPRHRPPPPSAAGVAKMIACHRRGVSVRQISRHCSAVETTIRKYLRLAGEDIDAPPARTEDDVIRQVRALRRQGWTYKRIGDALGVNRTSIRRYCQDLPCPYKRRNGYPDAYRQQARDMYAAGNGCYKIAQALGVSDSTVARWLGADVYRRQTGKDLPD